MLRRKANNYSNRSLWCKYVHAFSASWLQRQYLYMHTTHIMSRTCARTAYIQVAMTFCGYFTHLMIKKCQGIDKIAGCQVFCRAHLWEFVFWISADIKFQEMYFISPSLTGHDRRDPSRYSMYFPLLFFLRSKSCSGNIKNSMKIPSVFGSKMHVEMLMEKIIIAPCCHLIIPIPVKSLALIKWQSKVGTSLQAILKRSLPPLCSAVY